MNQADTMYHYCLLVNKNITYIVAKISALLFM